MPPEFAHTELGAGVIVAEGNELTVTVALPLIVARQPLESVAEVTEYVVVAPGLTGKTKGLAFVFVPPPLFRVTV